MIGVIVCLFMLMQCVAKQPYAILMHKVSNGHPISDLSPIKHMWDALDTRIRNRPEQPQARQELKIVLHEELLTIQDSTLHISNEETFAEHASRCQGRPLTDRQAQNLLKSDH